MSPFSATFPNILMVMEIIINSKTSVQSPLGDEVRKEHDEMMQGFFFYTSNSEQLNLHVDPKTGKEVAATPAEAQPSLVTGSEPSAK